MQCPRHHFLPSAALTRYDYVSVDVLNFADRFEHLRHSLDLNTPDVRAASAIARSVRESSGGHVSVQAKGVFIKERDLAQVTMNILK